MADQGISKLRGRGSRGGIEFLGSGKCFDAPQHIPWVFVVRVENKIHIGEGGYAPGAAVFGKHNCVVKNHKSA